jgi:hypothetical protein
LGDVVCLCSGVVVGLIGTYVAHPNSGPSPGKNFVLVWLRHFEVVLSRDGKLIDGQVFYGQVRCSSLEVPHGVLRGHSFFSVFTYYCGSHVLTHKESHCNNQGVCAQSEKSHR